MKLLNSLQYFFCSRRWIQKSSVAWAEKNYPPEQQLTAGRVATVLVDQLGVEFTQLAPDTRLNEDLGVDGYDMDDVELMMAIEEEFQITISENDAAPILTVGQLIQYVIKRIAEPGAAANGA